MSRTERLAILVLGSSILVSFTRPTGANWGNVALGVCAAFAGLVWMHHDKDDAVVTTDDTRARRLHPSYPWSCDWRDLPDDVWIGGADWPEPEDGIPGRNDR
jgi:hypothetical protein